MKTQLLLLLLLIFPFMAFSQEKWTDKSRILPDQLRDITTGIVIFHDPSPVYPELNSDTIIDQGKYIWKHSTQVSSAIGQLKVIAAGSYIWTLSKGWIPNIKLNVKDFAELFSCKNGILKKNKKYRFQKNFRYGDEIYPGDALWFVIAIDRKGKKYKGIAIVETEGILKTDK